MKHRPRPPEQDDLLRPRLVDMIDMRHELVKLAELVDWDWFDREWSGFFPSKRGRPATDPRLVAGLMYLQHAYGLSDEAVVARWVENPYFQHFTGETFFQHHPPIDPTSLVRWRKRIGEEGAEWLLTKTIEAGREAGVIDDGSLSRVAVDTTVMEKTSPTRRMPGSTTRPAGSWLPWPTKAVCSSGNPMPARDRGWPHRSADMPMPASSSACARP